MDGLKHFLELLNNNWPTIIAIIGLLYAIYLKAKKTWEDWQAMTEEQKKEELQKQIDIAMKLLGEVILSLVSQAEVAWYSEDGKLGQIKRSQVISDVFEMFPVLSYVTDQEELLAMIDRLIDEALIIVREKIRDASKVGNTVEVEILEENSDISSDNA